MRTRGWVILAMVISACAVPGPAPEDTQPATPPGGPSQEEVRVLPEDVPVVDISKHSVPLDRIYFDTFQPIDRAVPLTEASSQLIERLRDAIPPIHNPKYQAAEAADWLGPKDVILGYVVGEEAWAYPVRILNLHEIVNDGLAGEPVLISYCPLCYSGIVYSRRLGDRVLTFGNTSALYESDMVMLDYETGSYWWQVAGEAIVGPLTREQLSLLPSTMATWGDWRRLHPNTLVLSRDTGHPRNYDRDPFVGYAEGVNEGLFAFPVSEAGRDARLRPAAVVLALRLGEEARAYPLTELGRGAFMDTLAGRDVVVFADPEGPYGAAFVPQAGDQPLTFSGVGDVFTDVETGSLWDLSGLATDGPLAGSRLEPLPVKTSFWFALIAAEPEITVFYPPGG